MTNAHVPSAGAAQLGAVCTQSTIAAVARECGVNESAVRHWLTGRRTPASPVRERLFAAYGVAPSAWVRATSGEAPSAAPEPPLPASMGESNGPEDLRANEAPAAGRLGEVDAREIAVSTVRRLQRALDVAEQDAAATTTDRTRLSAALVSATRLLGRLSGDQLTPSAILRSQPWKEIVEVLRAALAPFPEARRAVIDAMAELQVR